MSTSIRAKHILLVLVLAALSTQINSQDDIESFCDHLRACSKWFRVCHNLFQFLRPRCTKLKPRNMVADCGVSEVTGSASLYSMYRVVGGNDSKEGEFPWSVRLTDGASTCGGTIINTRTVLTAAHCVSWKVDDAPPVKIGYGSVNSSALTYINASRVDVHPNYTRRGSSRFVQMDQVLISVTTHREKKTLASSKPNRIVLESYPPETIPKPKQKQMGKYPVTSYFVTRHRKPTGNLPETYRKLEDDDIAVVTLSQDLPMNLPSACLPSASTAYTPDKMCIVTGWGHTREGGPYLSEVLQKAALPIVARKVCNDAYATITNSFVGERQLCAGYYQEGGISACQGDSGGPLVCPEGDKWVIYGIVSQGFGCARPHFMGIYTYVPLYENWVRSIMSRE